MMIKRMIPIMLCLVLLFSVSALATEGEDGAGTEAPAVSEEMPVPGGGSRPSGGRGGMGGPPGGNPAGGEVPAVPAGEMPAMPEGEMPAGGLDSINGGMPGDMQSPEEAAAEAQTTGGIWGFVKSYSTPVAAVILLLFAFVFVKLYKRKHY